MNTYNFQFFYDYYKGKKFNNLGNNFSRKDELGVSINVNVHQLEQYVRTLYK